MSRRTHTSLPINRVISISWKRGICPQTLEEKRWLIGGDLDGLQFLTLYCERSRFGTVIHFWKTTDSEFESNTYAMQARNLFDEPWLHPDDNFASSLETAQAVLGLAIPALYPYRIRSRQWQVERAEGDDYCGIDALPFKDCLRAHSDYVLVVMTSVYDGEGHYSLQDITACRFGQLEGFEPDDRLASYTVAYKINGLRNPEDQEN